ncbi:MAG: RsmE family RNA methyltransferase [bacterium]|nr:RsmE family RNA methyltransferase [bacterium]
MSAPLFYASPDSFESDRITLGKEESNHAARVLRLKAGAPVIVVDGLGTAYRGEIVKCTGRSPVQIKFYSEIRNFGEPSVRLTLAAGFSTADKFDTVIQKGTELGVKRFVPLVTSKSKVSLDDPKRAHRKVLRLEKIVRSAVKQCRRSYCPEISVPGTVTNFLNQTDREATNLVFHIGPNTVPFDRLEWDKKPKRVSVMVGPESGFSDEEVEAAVEAGYRVISLGERVLRTETAGPVVCALIMNALGELR